LPPHRTYLESHFGGGAVLFAKDCDGVSEIVNDIDGDLTNFWDVIRDGIGFAMLRRQLEATPFSQSVWEAAAETSVLDSPVDRAFKFFVRCRQSLAGRMKSFASISTSRTRRGMNEQTSAWISAVDGLPAVHARLRRVLILNRDATKLLSEFDKDGVVIYSDLPYLPETRTAKNVYRFEMTAADHVEFLAAATALKTAKIAISAYRNDLYDDHLRRWRTVEFDVPNNAAGGDSKRRMTEAVYMNYNENGDRL
jgi:DNA adenine methylase